MDMESFTGVSAFGLAVVALATIAGWAGIDPAALATGPAPAGIEPLALQVLENLTKLLDRIADFLTQLNRVLSEFAQLFGEGGGGDG